jgi:hypothetical protein
MSYISRNSACKDGGISSPDSCDQRKREGGKNTRIKVSANSNSPCRIKCIAIVVLTSVSFPSKTSELITVEGSALNFFVRPEFKTDLHY